VTQPKTMLKTMPSIQTRTDVIGPLVSAALASWLSSQRLRESKFMGGKRTRNYGVPIACATTAQSLPL
jgi:hypothetical protein